jgi:hypothetical protein
MRLWIAVSIICIGSWAASVGAAPRAEAVPIYRSALQKFQDRDYQGALELIDQGLEIAPRHLDLLFLRASVLYALTDRTAAIAAYQACLDAGAKGRNRQEAQNLIRELKRAQPTSVTITVANGPAAIHLDLAQKPTCTAAPSCARLVPPGRHRIAAVRPGFERWTGSITVARGATEQLAITLVEKPSPLTVRVAQAGARVLVNGAPFASPGILVAGVHQVVVSLAGHRDEQREVVAHEGAPIEIEVALTPIVPVLVFPGSATMLLDGEPIAIEAGGIALPPGAHQLTVRAPGFVERRVMIRADRAGDYQITVALEQPPPPPPPPNRGLSTRDKLALGSTGIGVLAATTGVVLGLQANQRDREARALCPSPDLMCRDASRANELNQRARDRALEANVAYGAAGAAAIAAAILWFFGGRDTSVAFTPPAGAGAGLSVAGSF